MKNWVHYQRDEQAFVRRATDWIGSAIVKEALIVTPFLNPREQFILHSLRNKDKEVLDLQVDGGYPEAERRRAILYSRTFTKSPMDFQLTFLRIQNKNIDRIQHRDVLGTVLGLGMKREVIGDILPHRTGCDLIVESEVKMYFLSQLKKVGRQTVSISEIERGEIIQESIRLARRISVSSHRIDAIISAGFRISRKEAVQQIRSGKCKLNWQICEQTHRLVSEGDWISLTGFGRLQIKEAIGYSEKGKRRLMIEIIT